MGVQSMLALIQVNNNTAFLIKKVQLALDAGNFHYLIITCLNIEPAC